MKLAQDMTGAQPGGMPPAPTGAETMPAAGGMPGAPGAEGGAPPPPTFQIIHSPLDSLGKILADLDFKTFLENNFGTDPDVLANKIWVMYGGSANELQPGKKGERRDTPASADPMQLESIQNNEYNATRDSRWRRLPVGQSIDQITTPEALRNSIVGGYNSLAHQLAKPAEGGPAAAIKAWLKLANTSDQIRGYKYSDWIDSIITHVYSS